MTGRSSSRWAGAITRTSDDQRKRALSNLVDRRIALRSACKTISSRLAVPVGQRQDRLRGMRLARSVSPSRSGCSTCVLSWPRSRAGWLRAGDAGYTLGNGTIVVHPERHWCEIKLPAPLAYLSNRPGGRYRLTCPVVFTHRGDEWAAQATTGAVRYDITIDPAKGRWYLAASWRLPLVIRPGLEELRGRRALGLDVNADHLACWVLDQSGNPLGPPRTIALELDGLATSTRDGRLRAAITTVLRRAAEGGCRSIVVESLDFSDSRQLGRETLGRGRRQAVSPGDRRDPDE